MNGILNPHVCLFYRARQQADDFLLPFLEEGLENNEVCLWVSDRCQEAEEAARKRIRNFDIQLSQGRIDIIPHTLFCLENEGFNPRIALAWWVDRVNQLSDEGCGSIRIICDAGSINKRLCYMLSDLQDTMNRDRQISSIAILCVHSLHNCTTSQSMEIAMRHDLALVKRGPKWSFIKRRQSKRVDEVVQLQSEILSKAPAGALIVQRSDNTIIYCNAELEKMFGYERGELLGKNVAILNAPSGGKSAEAIRDEIVDALEKCGDWSGELKNIKKDGTIFYCRSRVSTSQSSRYGKVSIAFHADITERKRVAEELQRSRDELRNLSLHLQCVREEERKLVARRIHDDLGQSLAALRMELAGIRGRLPPGIDSLHERLEEAIRGVDGTIQQAREISTQLRPGILDDFGLLAAMEWEASEFQRRTGTQCAVKGNPGIAIGKNCAASIFEIFREALTNIAQHANATRVTTCIKVEEGKLVLQVRDNGRGITAEQVSSPKSFGLLGVKERVRFWGGETKIKGITGKGTNLKVIIPVGSIQEDHHDKDACCR
ncbi:MAG: MEDS domain-containing protein [Chloroflexi bacterium]|nr:MEDS domain-containing protein [Chloroflexota bacterium]